MDTDFCICGQRLARKRVAIGYSSSATTNTVGLSAPGAFLPAVAFDLPAVAEIASAGGATRRRGFFVMQNVTLQNVAAEVN
jgi:hypothetical protein